MDKNSLYYKQVQLLVRVLPSVAKETCFALKGGTAINLFVRDLPRLSVDIDLVYLPLDDRAVALAHVREALDRIAADILVNIPDCTFEASYQNTDALRLHVRQNKLGIKIELSPVLRGSVSTPVMRSVTEKVEGEFGFAEMQLLDLPDLYAGKICAALDRQHPRDLFDVKLLLENEGISADMRRTFIVYLISHNRTMAELLEPTRKNIRALYEAEFINMTTMPVSFAELEDVREQLIKIIQTSLTPAERDFLLGFKSGKPDWSLLELEGIDSLPAVRWKLQNLAKLAEDRRGQLISRLSKVLSIEQS